MIQCFRVSLVARCKILNRISPQLERTNGRVWVSSRLWHHFVFVESRKLSFKTDALMVAAAPSPPPHLAHPTNFQEDAPRSRMWKPQSVCHTYTHTQFEIISHNHFAYKLHLIRIVSPFVIWNSVHRTETYMTHIPVHTRKFARNPHILWRVLFNLRMLTICSTMIYRISGFGPEFTSINVLKNHFGFFFFISLFLASARTRSHSLTFASQTNPT